MELDHLVIGARTLEEGVAWCEKTLGVTPGPGGQHALMGTHNRLINISSELYPRTYLEIVAIDPAGKPPEGRARWFDLDLPALQEKLAEGPGLIHWVARVSNLDATLAQWLSEGVDAGEAVTASRGALSWRIALRPDGRRLKRESLPVPIEWAGFEDGGPHPTDNMPASGVEVLSFEARDGLRARLKTPLGEVELELIG